MNDKQADVIPSRKPPRRAARRWTIVAAILIALIAVVVFVLPGALAPFVRQKLESAVSNNLHARLEIGSLVYQFPYGVIVRDAKFVADDPESPKGVTLLSVKKLDLSLAELPLGSGPIVVQSFTVSEPVVHLIRREDGTVIGSHLLKRETESPQTHERMKLSDVLQLRHFDLADASIIYEDRTQAHGRPMEWRNIDARLNLYPQSGSRYAFQFAADSKPNAAIELKGAADIDSLIVDLETLAIDADVRRDQTSSALPAQLQSVFDELGVEGAVRLQASGQVPLKSPQDGKLALNLVLDRVRAQPVDKPWALDELSAKLRIERGMNAKSNQMALSLSDLIASGMGAKLQISSALGGVDLSNKTWTLLAASGEITSIDVSSGSRSVLRYVQQGRIEFDGTGGGSYAPGGKRIERAQMVAKIDRLAIQPPKFPQPLEAISGQIRLTGDRAAVQNVTALYGNDRISLNQAIVALGDLPQRIELLNILGNVEFVAPAPNYPAPLAKVMQLLNPTGKLDVQGAAALYRRDKRIELDYLLQLLPQDAGVTLLQQKIPVTKLRGEISVAPRMISTKWLEGQTLDGMIAVRGNLVPRAPVKYDVELRGQDTDLALLATAFGMVKPDGAPKFTGRAVTKLHLNGQIPRKDEGHPLQMVNGSGRLLIRESHFWSIRVLDGIATELRFGRDLLSAGQAAAVFDIKDGKLQFQRLAISSTAVGVQGDGAIGLVDKSLDLNLTVAPLGDWRRKLRRTGIPLVSDFAGDIAGALQKVVNSATSRLLYQFRVTGRVGDPKIVAVPTPFLTDSAAYLFATMMRVNGGPERLDNELAGPDPDEAPPPVESNTNTGGR